jgi:hypothetical protein
MKNKLLAFRHELKVMDLSRFTNTVFSTETWRWKFVATGVRKLFVFVRVWAFATRYETLYPCMKLYTQVWNFIPRYETLYPGMKLCTHVWNFIPRYETLYPGMKLCTQVWKFVPRYETLYPGMKLCT